MQDQADPNYNRHKTFLKMIFLLYAIIGFIFNMVEICSYIILYHFVTSQNNNVERILDPSVIRIRNRANAISLTGLFAGWLMEFWYVILLGFLSPIFDSNILREVSTVLKYFEFFFIPLVQINSSPPIKRFMWTLNHNRNDN